MQLQLGENEGMAKKTDHRGAVNEQDPVQSVTHAALPALLTAIVAFTLTTLNLIIFILETPMIISVDLQHEPVGGGKKERDFLSAASPNVKNVYFHCPSP